MRLLRILPWCVPVLGLLAAYAVMRPDALVAEPDVPFAANRLVYDESDLTAFALRGLNQHLGRTPGRRDEPQDPDWTLPPQTLPRLLQEPQPPLEARYYLEYPTPALFLFWTGFAVQSRINPDSVPAVVADGHQFSIAFYAPRTEYERQLWTRLRIAVQVYMALGIVGLLGLMWVLARGYEPGQPWGGPFWIAALPAAVFFSINRYDVLPAVAVALALAGLGRNRLGRAGMCLGIGVLLKLFPVVFVPVFLRYLGVRRSVRFLIGFTAVVAAGFGYSVLALGLETTLAPIQVQLARPFEANSWTFYGSVLPVALAEMKTARMLILILTVAACVLTQPKSLESVLRRCALILIVFVVLAVFWSPQWVLWFLPFLVPLGRNRWWPIVLAVVLDGITYFTFPVLFWNLLRIPAPEFHFLIGATIYFRAALWLLLARRLIVDEYRLQFAVDPAAVFADFRANRERYLAGFLQQTRTLGKPRGLIWSGVVPLGEPVSVRDQDTRCLALLVPLEVTFVPEPGSDMEAIPQAREPRPITVIFRYQRRRWQTDGRAVFNLRPEQVIERSAGRFQRVEIL